MSVHEWAIVLEQYKIWFIAAGLLIAIICVFSISSIRKRPLKSVLVVLILIFGVFGSYLLYSFVNETRMVRAAQTWPTAPRFQMLFTQKPCHDRGIPTGEPLGE